MINAIIENTAKQTNYKDILIKIIIKDLDGKTIYEQPFPLDAILEIEKTTLYRQEFETNKKQVDSVSILIQTAEAY